MRYQPRAISADLLILLLILIALLLIAWSIYMIVKNNKIESKQMDDSSIKILKERYAKGEIDEETYIKMKNALNFK